MEFWRNGKRKRARERTREGEVERYSFLPPPYFHERSPDVRAHLCEGERWRKRRSERRREKGRKIDGSNSGQLSVFITPQIRFEALQKP